MIYSLICELQWLWQIEITDCLPCSLFGSSLSVQVHVDMCVSATVKWDQTLVIELYR